MRNVGTKPAIQAANRRYRDSFTRREGKADIERGRTMTERGSTGDWHGPTGGEADRAEKRQAISRREMVGWARRESERGEGSRGGIEGGGEEGA